MIFNNATVITMNANREILTRGAVLVEGTRIKKIGKSQEILSKYPNELVIDCSGNVLMPGLVDTHVHTAQAMIRGCADDLGLIDWLVKRVWVLQGNYNFEDGAASAELCALEMIKSGTTSFIECMLAEVYGFDGVAETLIKSGLRAAIGKIVMDTPSYAKAENVMHTGMIEDGETSIKNTLAAHEKWNGAGDGRIQVWFGPRTPGGVTPDLYDRISIEASKRNMGITVHISEVSEDIEYAQSVGYRSPTEFALAHGLLGPRSVLAHFIWSDEQDWQVIAETGTHITHNPASNGKTASGIAPIQGLIDSGVNVTLGCDGGPSNNTYDMIRDMRLVSYLANLREDDPTVVPAETVIEMATINGARAMGIDKEVGSIEEGKKADFIVIDMDKSHLTPAPDPVSTIVYAAHGSDVDTVVVNGKILMRDRKVLVFDEEMEIENARTRYKKVAERAGLNIGPRWPVI